MIEEILNSDAKIRIVKTLSKFPNRQFQAIEMAGLAKLSVSRTSECLKELVDKGVLKSRKIGKGYLFELDMSNYLVNIILEMFRKEKNLVDIIAKDFASKIKKFGKIKSIVLFGSATKELKLGSDIDLLVISDAIDKNSISKIASGLTAKYGFPISSLIMTVDELKRKMEAREDFILNVTSNGKVIFGKDLERLIWSEK